MMCYNCNERGHLRVCCPTPKEKVKEVDQEAGMEASENVMEAIRLDVIAFSMQVQVDELRPNPRSQPVGGQGEVAYLHPAHSSVPLAGTMRKSLTCSS